MQSPAGEAQGPLSREGSRDVFSAAPPVPRAPCRLPGSSDRTPSGTRAPPGAHAALAGALPAGLTCRPHRVGAQRGTGVRPRAPKLPRPHPGPRLRALSQPQASCLLGCWRFSW